MLRRDRSELLEQLKSSSRRVRALRAKGDRLTAIAAIDGELRNHGDTPLRALWQRWQVDDAMALGRAAESLERIEALVGEYGDVVFANEAWSSRVGVHEVRLLDRMGRPGEALERCHLLAAQWPETFDVGSCLFELGRSAEHRNERDAALDLYEAASSTQRSDNPGPQIQDLARGMHTRLRTGARWARATAEELRAELLRAIRAADAKALATLASRGNFYVGALLGEPSLVSGERFADWLASKLRSTKGRVEITERIGRAGMVWLGIRGLSGFDAETVLELGLGSVDDEVEWGWAVVQAPIQADTIGDLVSFVTGCGLERTSSPPVVLPLKAPWPAGVELSAGGLFGGLYYNQGPTHCARSAFAIDFANGLDTFGIPVLAVHQGLVTRVHAATEDFDSYTANVVHCDLVPDEGAAVVLLQLLFGGDVSRTQYDARYYHLRGPDVVPVSEGMWVDLGTQLGEIDSTGRSVASHLHFALHDRTIGGLTVMPTPMDAVTLELDDAGTWITSTNVPQP